MIAINHTTLAAVLLVLLKITVKCGAADSDQLVEIACQKNADCSIYQLPDINVRCENFQCLCHNDTSTLSTPCKPANYLVKNRVGGPCPCALPYTTCSNEQICTCMDGFVPTSDKLRCIPNLSFTCTNDTDCTRRIDHTICMSGKCMCNPDFVASSDHSECLVNVKAGGQCTMDVQCKTHMRMGGICKYNANPKSSTCECDARDYAQATIKSGNETITICENRIAIGDPCTTSKDCMQSDQVVQPPPFECDLLECTCSYKNGYQSKLADDRYCTFVGTVADGNQWFSISTLHGLHLDTFAGSGCSMTGSTLGIIVTLVHAVWCMNT